MRNKTQSAQLVYYTFEIDLLFTPRFQSEPEASAFEVALENYRMMFDRIQMGKRLTPARIRARRALFILRNMRKIRY